ncbi:MAG: S4 domain-containing protein [Steroidobacteraceae bacterium]
MSERLHKVLAQHGIGSRREVERWIIEGRLQINGVIAKTGDRYETGDRVQLDGRDVSKRLDHVITAQVLAYHKPQGQPIERPAAERQSSEHAPEVIDESVEERLPVQRGSRWVAINPMHPGDSGLLLFTNDGALSYALTRQKKKIPATYMVRVHVRGGVAAAPVIPTVLRLDDEIIDFTEVSVSSSGPEGESESGNIWYKVVMARADRRAAVRALFVSNELTVSRMMQVAFGSITLTKEMPRARSLPLKPNQVEQLYALAQLKMPVNPALRPAGMNRSRGHGSRATRDDAAEMPALTAQEARTATRARPLRSAAPTMLDENVEPRGPQQRAALRRTKGGGSNRSSRPAPARPKR